MQSKSFFFFLTWVLSNFWLSKDGNDEGALYLYKFFYLQSSLQLSFYFHLNVTIYSHEAIWAVVLCTFYGWEPSQVFLTLLGVLLATPSAVMESAHSRKPVRHVSAQPGFPSRWQLQCSLSVNMDITVLGRCYRPDSFILLFGYVLDCQSLNIYEHTARCSPKVKSTLGWENQL